ncbi:hypothetical protein GCM10018784_80950 [Streptomyces hydrogenans]|nr:hypothetical protein GCM10018784_80950 [Streptomyces hydrogenans]
MTGAGYRSPQRTGTRPRPLRPAGSEKGTPLATLCVRRRSAVGAPEGVVDEREDHGEEAETGRPRCQPVAVGGTREADSSS